MDSKRVSYDEFIKNIKDFIELSTTLNDDWKLCNNSIDYGMYILKESFKEIKNITVKAEYIVSFNVSYSVPSFSFNYWNSSGVLLTLNEIKSMSLIKFDKDEYNSVISQQEHPLLFRPVFTVHPCHTGSLLAQTKSSSRNLIVTFLSIISPLIQLNLPLEYAL